MYKKEQNLMTCMKYYWGDQMKEDDVGWTCGT